LTPRPGLAAAATSAGLLEIDVSGTLILVRRANLFFGSRQYFPTWSVNILMEPSQAPFPTVTARERMLEATVLRERTNLGRFIRRRVQDPMDAEDLLQDVLGELMQVYRLPEPIEQVTAWLYRVARNRIIDRFRRSKRRPSAELNSAPDEADPEYHLDLVLPGLDQGPEALYARSIVLDALQQALEELPPEQREVFIEHELAGSSFKEMSVKTGTAVNTLLSRKHSAILHLRNRLQSVYDDLDL
jgi:RNA polymerase sigma factor (sigma-70 family)